MKVREFISRFNMSSNALVAIVTFPGRKTVCLSRRELIQVQPTELMDMTLSSFTIEDNRLTIYAR